MYVMSWVMRIVAAWCGHAYRKPVLRNSGGGALFVLIPFYSKSWFLSPLVSAVFWWHRNKGWVTIDVKWWRINGKIQLQYPSFTTCREWELNHQFLSLSVSSYKALCRLYTYFTSKDVFMHTVEYLVTCFVLTRMMQHRHHSQFATAKFFYSNRINDLLLFLFCFVFLFSASRCFFSPLFLLLVCNFS